MEQGRLANRPSIVIIGSGEGKGVTVLCEYLMSKEDYAPSTGIVNGLTEGKLHKEQEMSKFSMTGMNKSGLVTAIRMALANIGMANQVATPQRLKIHTPTESAPPFLRGPSSFHPHSKPVCTKKAWKARRKQSSKKYKRLR